MYDTFGHIVENCVQTIFHSKTFHFVSELDWASNKDYISLSLIFFRKKTLRLALCFLNKL